MASSIPLFTQYYYSTYVRPNLAFLPLFARQRFPSRSILFLEKKSVAKAKIFFLFFQRIRARPIPPHLTNGRIFFIHIRSQFVIHSGGSVVDRCNFQIVDVGRKKLDRVQLGKKSIFLDRTLINSRASTRKIRRILNFFFLVFLISFIFTIQMFHPLFSVQHPSNPPNSQVARTSAVQG